MPADTRGHVVGGASFAPLVAELSGRATNANVMNGITPGAQIVSITPQWQNDLRTFNIVAGIVLALAAGLMTYSLVRSVKKKRPPKLSEKGVTEP